MNDGTLVTYGLGLHSGILLAALAAFYKYGDRSGLVARSLQGTDAVLQRLREQIASELATALTPVFRDAGSVPVPILGPTGETYTEHPVNAVGSERYREAVRHFLEQDAENMADYNSLRRSRACWCMWTRNLSWCVLLLVLLEAVAVAGLIVVEKILSLHLPAVLLKCSMAVSVAGAGACLLQLPFILFHHDRILKLRTKHDEF